MNLTHISKLLPVRHSMAIGLFALLLSCSVSEENLPVEADSSAEEAENNYNISASQFQSANMKLGRLGMRDFHDVVKATGVFDVPPQNRVSISAYFGGYVKEIKLLPGEKVKKGQTLFVLENPAYVQIQQDFLEAKSQLSYLKTDYERQKSLSDENITSQKNFLKAESEYMVTKVRYESLKKKLGLMNINTNSLSVDNIRTTLNVITPISGYVTAVNAIKGAFLNPSDIAVNIVDTDHMHLELNIFEKDLAKVSVGQMISFKTQEDNFEEAEAKVYLVNKSVDPDNRTIAIHGHLIDEKSVSNYTSGMYVEAEIFTKTTEKLSLPEEAIVDLDNNYYVLVVNLASNESYSFDRRQVKLGQSNDGFVEILNTKDFKEDAQFLVSGAFQLIKE